MINCLKCNNSLKKSEAIYGLHGDCFIEWFDHSNIEFMDIDPKKTSAEPSGNPEIKMQKNTFFHGNYLKYSARLGQTQYILKVQETRFPELPHVEYLCNQIAEILKIEVPPYYLIDFNGRITFVTRNFMQDYTGTLHHIYKFLLPGSENHNCEEILNTILAQTQRFADAVKFIEICLFDTLIGNNDRHGRNLGLIETAALKKLAPMYDNPSCLSIEEEFFLLSNLNPSGSIWTKASKEPRPKDYIIEFNRLGYEKIVSQFCKKVISQSDNIIDKINQTNISEVRKNALRKLLKQRVGEFANDK